MQVSSRWLKLCCSLEFGDCGVAVRVQAGVQAQDTSEGTVCFRIVWSNSHSLARLRFGIFQLAVLSKRICKIDACLREIGSDRKSTRLNSSHQIISYAVFC